MDEKCLTGVLNVKPLEENDFFVMLGYVIKINRAGTLWLKQI